MNINGAHPNALQMRPYLLDCGYGRSHLAVDVEVAPGRRASLVAFAHSPFDSRSSCIAVLDQIFQPETELRGYRSLGAPLVFNAMSDHWQLWKQGAAKPELVRSLRPSELPNFFKKEKDNLAPESVYRAKTWARLDKSYQLDFVDLGLMPLVEEEAGRKLSTLIERTVVEAKSRLGWRTISEEQGQWLLKSNFWLLAAKILRDKSVPTFVNLDLENLNEVFARVAQHYSATAPVAVGSKRQADALQESARAISALSHLGLVSTDALAYLYENALITKETRSELGTHSTPTYLVDYIVGKLRPWIEEIPADQRQVFEPACGHAAFLLAAMRLLGELPPVNQYSSRKRHQYLRERLHGLDYDDFALEIARLSLTLADVPNPDGWDLKPADMFKGDLITHSARTASIVLANPPFRNFSADEQREYTADPIAIKYTNKAAEMLWRVVTDLKAGAVFGVVLPQNVLHSENAASLRQFLMTNFEISEVCLFPDKVFTFSDAESALILGRRLQADQKNRRTIHYRRVRESGVADFRQAYKATQDYEIRPSRFSEGNEWSFLVPDLEEIWNYCQTLPHLGDSAEVGQGFQFRSTDDPMFPAGAVTESKVRRSGMVKGFARLHRRLQTHQLPEEIWLNLDPAVIRRPGHGVEKGTPQVLLNYAPVSRGPWRLKAFIDQEGHPVTSRFLVIRPKASVWPLEALWAICNSPFANAFSYAFSGKRDVLAGLMRELPVPNINAKNIAPLLKAVDAYWMAVHDQQDAIFASTNSDELKTLQWRIDAEALRLYDLPPHLERQLLDLFTGIERRGVPFKQTDYIPKGFSDISTLSELLAVTADWGQTNERRAQLILKEVKKTISPAENRELDYLQNLADARISLLAPLPIKELEALRDKLKQRGMWEE
jgi:type I restriction-modification system DNA methylase subunit